MHSDHYHALGVPPQATQEEIRAAYLRLMRQHHPDHRPDDPHAAERAREVNAAFEVLRSSARRAAYDRLRTARAGTVEESAGATAARLADAEVVRVSARSRPIAYGSNRTEFRAAFSAACLRVGAATFALGLLLLFALS